MKKHNICRSLLAVAGTVSLCVLLLISCEKWELAEVSFPEVHTGAFAPGANPTAGTLSGNIQGLLSSAFVEDHGHVWALVADPLPSVETNGGISRLGRSGNRSFTTAGLQLNPGADYQYRAYIIAQDGKVHYGERQAFTTLSLQPNLVIDSIVSHPTRQLVAGL